MPRVTTHTHTVQHVGENAPRPHLAGGSTLTLCERDVPTGATSIGGGGGLGPVPGKNAESLQITLKDHPSMSFRNKGHVDIEVRYKPTAAGKGKPMLEKIVVTESDKCPLMEERKCGPIASKCLKTKKMLDKIEKPVRMDTLLAMSKE